MPSLDPAKIRKARTGYEPVSIKEMLNSADAVFAIIAEKLPDWLVEELACNGITAFKTNGEWFLGPLGE